MVKRNYPAVLRYNKPNKDNNPERYLLHELMLYRPLHKEVDIEEAEALYNETYEGKRKVDLVKSQVMEHLEGVEEARYYVEQVKKEIDLTEVGNALDPALEQNNADCDEEVELEHPEFTHRDPEQIPKEEETMAAGNYKRVEIPNLDELKRKTRTLDKWQKGSYKLWPSFCKRHCKRKKTWKRSRYTCSSHGLWRCWCWQVFCH